MRCLLSLLSICLVPMIVLGQGSANFQMGPVASVGVSSLTGEIPAETGTNIQPAFMLGFLGAISASDDWSVLTMLGYESRSMYLHPEGHDEPNQTISVQCITIQAALKWKSISIGLSVSEPLSGYQTMSPDPYFLSDGISSDTLGVMYSVPIKTTNLNTIFDLRASILLPVFTIKRKTVNLFAQLTYCLSNIVNDEFAVVPIPGSYEIKPLKNSRVSMIQVGLSYFFSSND